jgi:Domain of unknown function (DUF1906)/FG-GAP-like repeat
MANERSVFSRAALLVAVLVLAAASTPARAADTKTVSFRGVTVEVPTDWPVFDLRTDPTRCVRYDAHAVYLGAQGPDADCPSRLVDRTETVQLEPFSRSSEAGTFARHRTTWNGQTALTDPGGAVGGNLLIAFPRPSVAVTVTFGRDRALADEIASSADASGAPSSASSAATANRGASTTGVTAAASQPAPLQPGVASGKGFDTCANPALDKMEAWLRSPYRTIGIYIGGINHGCKSQTLSADWVASAARMGWSFIPTYVGLQAPCTSYTNKIDAAQANGEGASAASDAVSRADLFGLPSGSPIYFDMEAFSYSTTSCRQAVQKFLSSWTYRLHKLGYLSGVYGSAGSTMRSLVDVYNDPNYYRPDAIWNAHWDDRATVFGDSFIPDTMWANHQRLHQYHGGHQETWNGVTINIDNDFLDGPVVRFQSVARWVSGDVSGDGTTDLIHLCCRDYLNSWFSNGDGTYTVHSFRPATGYGLQLGQWLVADVSGDGKADLVHLCCGDYFNVLISRGDGTFDLKGFRPWPGYGVQTGSWRPGDVNGDGKADLIHICCNDFMHVWLSNGDGTFRDVKFRPWKGYGMQTGSWQTGDFNKDGRTDLVHLCCKDHVNVLFGQSNGAFAVTEFRPAAGYGVQLGSWQAGDVNGDGATDLIHLCCADMINTWTSNLNGTFTVAGFRPAAGYRVQSGRWLVSDFSGDGKADLVHLCCSDYINAWKSIGDGSYVVTGFRPWPGYAIGSGTWRPGLFSADGKGDLLHLCCPGSLNTWLSQGDGTYSVVGSPI